jgi:hypothetical protein
MSKPSVVRLQVNDPDEDDAFILHLFDRQIHLSKLFSQLDKEEFNDVIEAMNAEIALRSST